jgi:hypothetical protein
MVLRLLKNRQFDREARKGGLTDSALRKAVVEIEAGLVEARLGGFLLKKRVARDGGGKRTGFRIIVAYRQRDRLVCLFVFGKKDLGNIKENERLALCEAGNQYMNLTTAMVNELVAAGTLIEVQYDGKENK